MSASNQLPPNLRFLKARVQPFLRPAFLGSVTVFSMLIVAIVGYWQHPEWLEGEGEGDLDIALNAEDKTSQERLAQAGVSLDELAASAEQGNVTSLLRELDNSLLASQSVPKDKNKKRRRKKKEQKSLEQLIEEKNPSIKISASDLLLPNVPKNSQKTQNPFATSTQNFLTAQNTTSPLTAVDPSTTTSLSPPSPLFSPSSASPQAPVSPLQQALNQANSPSPEVPSESSSNDSEELFQNTFIPTNSITDQGNSTPSFGSTPANATVRPQNNGLRPITPNTPNAYTFLIQPQAVEVLPNPALSPLPNTTPPSALNSPNNFGQIQTQPLNTPRNPFAQTTSGNALGGGQATPQPLVNQPQSPFSTPRSTPGRYIGGGQINTFSNP